MYSFNKIKSFIHYFLPAWIFIFYSASTFAQSINFKGIVIDAETKAQLSHVTITLTDSQNVETNNSNLTAANGSFKIKGVAGRQYKITLTSAGYKDTCLNLPSLKSSYDIGVIPLISLLTPLEKVEVLGVKPLIEQEIDGLKYNVSADPESNSSNALDILRKIPVLTIDGEDNILLNGNTNYRILVNGKPSLMFMQNQADIFRNLDAAGIKTIEVISVPSSKYQSEGIGGIINIITDKKGIGGLNAGLNIRKSTPENISGSANAVATLGKFSISGNGAYSKGVSPSTTNKFTREDNILKSKMIQYGSGIKRNSSENAGGVITYDINALNTISAGINYYSMENHHQADRYVNLFDASDQLTGNYTGSNKTFATSATSDISFDFQRTFKRNDRQQLSLSYRTGIYEENMDTRFNLSPSTGNEIYITVNSDNVSEQIATADYVQPLGKHTLELGVSTEERKNTAISVYRVFDSVTSTFITDTTMNSDFKYKEKISSGYISLDLKMGRWAIKSGVRAESVLTNAHFISSGTNIKRQYTNVMPGVTLSHLVGKRGMIAISYSQRINRPDLLYLDPYIDMSDQWNISYGNPDLVAALSHVFNFSMNLFIKKTGIRISAYHQFSNNSIQQITRLGTDTVTHTTYDNVGANKSSSVSFNVNTTVFRKLILAINNTATYFQYPVLFKNNAGKNNGITYFIGASATLGLKTWSASANVNYNAPIVLVQGTSGSYATNSIALNKYLFKNRKLTVGVSANNPFNDRRVTIRETHDPDFNMWQESVNKIRRINMSVNYRLSRLQKNANR